MKKAHSQVQVPKIDRWYTKRDAGLLYVVGYIQGHAKRPDGHHIATSFVRTVEGTRITTESGSVYDLLTPDDDWLAWMKAKGIAFDPAHPIRLVDELSPAAVAAEEEIQRQPRRRARKKRGAAS